MADARDELAAELGILPGYTDQTRRRRRTRRATQIALMRAMGVEADTAAQAEAQLAERRATARRRALPDYVLCTPGKAATLRLREDVEWHLQLEDGATQSGHGPTLPALPLGLHRLCVGAESCPLICAPDRLPLPPRLWGMTAPLYGLRGPGAGLADTDDLATAGRAVAQRGGAFLGLNPVHAGFWAASEGYSPYSPSHRRRLSAFHIPTAQEPGSATGGGGLIDYPSALADKRRALERAYAAQQDSAEFDAYLQAEGTALIRFATHQALSDLHGAYWTDWPAALQSPDSPETARVAATLSQEIRFHAWLQFRAAQGLAQAQNAMEAAGAPIGLYLDLAVGTHPAGAETWEDHRSFAKGVSLGAPPDAFSSEGQRWGLAPFNPHALIETGFAPLAETLRSLFRHAGAVRIDHILGFDRAFWVPDTPGLPGAYLRMPRDAMLAVLRLEAARVGGVVVGEDLGNVPRGLRGALDKAGILGCRVALFEQAGDPPRFRDPKHYPAAALASFSTHDLPTWRGWRAGHDIALRRDLGHISGAAAAAHLARRSAEVTGFDEMTARHRPKGTPPVQHAGLCHAMAASGAALVAMQAETVFEVTAQPNLPGTTDAYPNWQQPLPVAAKDWHEDVRLLEVAQTMQTHGRGSQT